MVTLRSSRESGAVLSLVGDQCSFEWPKILTSLIPGSHLPLRPIGDTKCPSVEAGFRACLISAARSFKSIFFLGCLCD